MSKDAENYGKIYLPPGKNTTWADPESLFDSKKNTHNKNYGKNMDILNEDSIEAALLPKVNSDEITFNDTYHDNSVYLTPGIPKHRSDSLSR